MRIEVRNCRLSFANIFKPNTPKSGEPKFNANGICSDATVIVVKNSDGTKTTMPHTDMPKVIAQICKDKWGKEIPAAKLFTYVYARADQQVDARGPKINSDGDYYDGYTPDTMFFSGSCKTSDAPKGLMVVDQNCNRLDASSGFPVNGDYVNLILDVFAYEYEGKKGVSASLGGVQYLRKGVPFGTSNVTESDFDVVELDDSDVEDFV